MSLRLLHTEQVSDGTGHQAFTGLAQHRARWFCCYRRAESHVSADGIIAVASRSHGDVSRSSGDASRSSGDPARPWHSTAELASPDPRRPDLRDPKLVAADDFGLVLLATATARGGGATCQSYLWHSADGTHWSGPEPAGAPDVWLWGLAVQGRTLLAGGYAFNGAGRETDGAGWWETGSGDLHFEQVAPLIGGPSEPNETAPVSGPAGVAALVRRRFGDSGPDGGRTRNGTALLGTAPHAAGPWTWHDTGTFIGGPVLLAPANGAPADSASSAGATTHGATTDGTLIAGTLIAGGRSLHPRPRTVLWRVDRDTGALAEFAVLPSGGDCGYPGLVADGDGLYVSHYSSHNGGTRVYFSQLAGLADTPDQVVRPDSATRADQ